VFFIGNKYEALSAAIMASALELGKIVSISFLYQYWKEIPRALKSYLSVAAVVLMIITSAGIYGYLSSAYAKVAATPLQLSADIQATSGRIGSIEQDIKRKEDRLNQLISLRAQQETRLDQLVSRSTTGNNTTIRSAQSALTAADRNVTTIQNEISKLSEQRDSLRGITIGKQVEIETNGDIGTFVYIAKMFGVPLDVVVKWFTLIIVLVFDPLAVALVIAVNFLLKNKTEEKTLINNIENKNIIVSDEAFDKIQELIENPPEPTEALKQLLNKEDIIEHKEESASSEPYQVYVNRQIPGNDPQYYLRGDFDWTNRAMWEHDPIAVEYYDTRIKPRLKKT